MHKRHFFSTVRSPRAPGKLVRTVSTLALGLLAIAACDNKRELTTPVAVSIAVTPTPVTLAVGTTQQFTATAKDLDGITVDITEVWSATTGGTISASGMFTAGTVPGTYTNAVRATNGTLSGNATVIVVAGPIASITVSPNPATMGAGTSATYTAVAKDAAGNVVVFTPTWSVTGNAGSIAQTGVFTAGSVPGTYTNIVRASNGTVSGTATAIVTAGPLASITVSPTPMTLATGGIQQYTAVGADAFGNAVTITPVWSVTTTGGTITAGGLFTAGAAAGTFPNIVRATSGTIFGSGTVTITPPPLATITVSPNPATLLPNGPATFTAVGRDAAGNVVAITPVWSATNGTINSISGAYNAGATSGTFANAVTARSGTISGSATVIVQVVPVPPSPGTINLGAAALNGIMAGQSVTCGTGGIVNANIAVSPGNTLTGFGPCIVTGVTHLGDAIAQQGQLDLTAAYNQLAGLACPPANVISANLGGTTMAAGVYCSAGAISVTGPLTLNGGGDSNAVFVFQAGSSLTTAGSIILINGAQAKNVYWQVGSSATLGTASAWKGNILALTTISMIDNATLTGRALARNGSVTMTIGNIIILP